MLTPNLNHIAPTGAQSSWQGRPLAIGASEQQQQQGLQSPGMHGQPPTQHPVNAVQQLQQPLTVQADVGDTRLQEDTPPLLQKRRRQSRFHPEADEIAAVLALAGAVPPPTAASASLPGSDASSSHAGAGNAVAAGQNPPLLHNFQLCAAPSDPCTAARQAAVANAAGQPANGASTVPLAHPPGPMPAAPPPPPPPPASPPPSPPRETLGEAAGTPPLPAEEARDNGGPATASGRRWRQRAGAGGGGDGGGGGGGSGGKGRASEGKPGQPEWYRKDRQPRIRLR